MPDRKFTSLAVQFIDFVGTVAQVEHFKPYMTPKGEVEMLVLLVEAAGFEPKAVVPGKLLGNYCDQDGSATGQTYPINSLFPFKVLDKEGKDHYFATGWLDCAFKFVCAGLRQKEDRDTLIETFAKNIEQSIPLLPVQLTAGGDLLSEYPPSVKGMSSLEYFVEHTRDDGELACCVGVHKYCGGWMDRNRATKTHDAISCRKCHLRVLFPREVATYGELRKALSFQEAPVSA